MSNLPILFLTAKAEQWTDKQVEGGNVYILHGCWLLLVKRSQEVMNAYEGSCNYSINFGSLPVNVI